MRKTSVFTFILFLTMFIFTTGSQAIELGNDITIFDKISSTSSSWYGQHEDQEVEPGCVGSQAWDLEGFYLNGSILSMVGGFDFENGYSNVSSGDIFIDTDGVFANGSNNDGSGQGNTTVQNTFGYEYVLDLDFTNHSYNVYALNNASTVTIYYGINQESNPWQYDHTSATNSSTQSIFTNNFDFFADLADSEVDDLTGGTHYVASFDLSFLAPETNFVSHFTLGCGNDNLMGQGTTPVPEPTTIALMFAGMLGIFGLRRRKK